MALDNLSALDQHSMVESINSEQPTLKICKVLVSVQCEIALEVCKDFVTCENNYNRLLHAKILKLLHRILNALILCY